MKRIISCLLAVLLLVPAFYRTSAAAAAKDEPTFTVSSEQADPGQKVSVTIRMDHNPGIASIRMKVHFDSALILDSVRYNDAGLGGRSQQPETFQSPVTLNWFNGEADTMGDMTYAVLDFTVAQNASVGLHTVSVAYDEDDVYNIAEDNIPFSVADGGVNVVISVSGLALNHKSATVYTGDETYTLTPVFTPANATNKKVTWTSSDTSVATVDGGVVTLLKKGRVVITAVSDDGGFTAACKINVLCSHLTYEVIPAEASTCIKQGHDTYTVCLECGEIISGSDALLPYAEHRYVEKVRLKYRKSVATCVSPAVYYKSCSVCGEASTETFLYGAVNPSNHVGGTHLERQAAASCKSAGYTGDVVCDSCGEIITQGSVIEKLAHTPASPVRENEVPATCTEAGGYDEVIYCTVCGEELSREHKTVPATGHTYGEPEWAWRGYGLVYVTINCVSGDDRHRMLATITSEVTKQPSLTEEGERTYRATVTFMGEVYTDTKIEPLPKLYILGDVDESGEVESVDATWIQRRDAGIDIPYAFRNGPADVDGDGKVTLMDVSFIQKYLVSMDTPYQIGKVIQ